MGLRGSLYYAGAMLRGREWQRYLREIQSVPAEVLSSRYLGQTIEHAVINVPYYRSLGLSTESPLASFPILTRRLLRERLADLQAPERGSERWQKAATGGSTGEPVWILHDRAFRKWDYAIDMYYLSDVLGMPIPYYLSHKRLLLWHRREAKGRRASLSEQVAQFLGQCAHLEPYTVCSEETLLGYANTVNRVRPVVIWAFASSLYELARFAVERRIRLHRPHFIISSVEMLYPEMRATIESAFGCPVYDSYGAVETGRVAAECSEGKLHVFTFNNHVEVLDAEDKPTPPGEEGRLVITPFHNRAMPLLRYDIGDMARVSAVGCSCGSPLPVLENITGRVIEHFVTIDGRVVYGGYFVAMFYDQDWVSEFQVLQKDVDDMVIYYKTMADRLVPPGAFEGLTASVREVIGPGCRVEWVEVDAVPRTPLGKYLHTRSLVWEERRRER